ncbi:hypothetical protein CMV_011604 [Castanea mollissima]|uniref:Uncharacterized protein n=1 Tax=Castanea mollissima TaxID=60419 RepID=A0A8J4RKJ1_9ROSI|nr:hypothetical protein CMV_011604 [Castanea mollissima]
MSEKLAGKCRKEERGRGGQLAVDSTRVMVNEMVSVGEVGGDSWYSVKFHPGGEDEMVWNIMENRKFDVISYCRASKVPIGAMFPWSPRDKSKFEEHKYWVDCKCKFFQLNDEILKSFEEEMLGLSNIMNYLLSR